ncbi:MAG: PH domain-containing protein [Chloroflexota bacterium]
MRFELQKNLLNRFYQLTHIFTILFAAVWIVAPLVTIFIIEEAPTKVFAVFIGAVIVLSILFTVYLLWHSQKYTQSLEYQVEDNILFIQEGVFTYQRKSIPLDRVTDIRMVQTLLMRWVGIWRIHVQTAGVGVAGPEGVLWAVESPKAIRQQLLALRHQAVMGEQVQPAA